ncbi:hypothetical protein PoHVEF18_004747 [Penicillium ochrochloron]
MAQSPQLHECTIVWLCPLEVELRAAIAMLDRVSDHVPHRARGQHVVYTVGEIGPHKIAVVGYYQEQGLAASGSMAAEVMRDLPRLQFGLLVGIAGGIPSSTIDMQLGDVAVAVPEGDRPGIVGYDLGKAGENDKFELKHWQNSTDPMLRSVINVIRAREDSRFWRHLRVVENRPEFQRPENTSETNRMHPKVHYGTILSGNTVIKSQSKRDQLREMYGGIAVEMEAAGIMTRLPVAVIRGISDFADSSKNSTWQPYAAIAAAAYAREVLLCLPCEAQTLETGSSDQRGGQPQNTNLTPFADKEMRLAKALPEKWAFVGREEELAFLQSELFFPSQSSIQKHVVCLWGLTGAGKSQLAARFVHQQLSLHPEREIFWISGESRDSFEESVINMLKARQESSSTAMSPPALLPIIPEGERRAHMNLFFAELNRLNDGRWLLIIDGVNQTNSPATQDAHSFDVHSHIRGLTRGSVLLTSQRRDVVERYHPIREVKGLKNEDAMSLLKSQINSHSLQGAQDLISLLRGLPLALRLAISVISRYRLEVQEYLEMWKSRGDVNEILGTDETLYRSMELSLEDLERSDPIAANLLALFSFLDHHDLWYELCLNAVDDTFPQWLQDLARHKTPFRNYYPLLADLSFIELKISTNGRRTWETHPAIQAVVRRRVKGKEQEYVRSAISLVAVQVPRSSMANSWPTVRRLLPHAQICWSYIKAGKWGSCTNLTELESLARNFRQTGHYEEASIIYRMITRGLDNHSHTPESLELLADVLANLGLVYTHQHKFEAALMSFDGSYDIMGELGTLTPLASMSITYNKAVVFMMTDRLDEAETFLRDAAEYFAQNTTENTLIEDERRSLYFRILNDMGEVMLRKGSVPEAFQVFQHVYYGLGDSSQQGDPQPAQVSLKLNMGRALTKLGDFSKARELLEEVISIYTEWWGRRHPETMRVIDELAWTLMEESNDKRAKGDDTVSEGRRVGELWNEALDFYRRTGGDASDTFQ